MSPICSHPPITPPVIERILFAGRLGPQPTSFSFSATSRPGHLIHLIVSGHVRQQCNGRSYHLHPGQLIWYHEDEWVTGTVTEGPWTFYSVNFLAPTIPPPTYEARVFSPREEGHAAPVFDRLLNAWESPQSVYRDYRVQAALLELLALTTLSTPTPTEPDAQLWWDLETRVRALLHEPISLRRLSSWCGRSQATIHRAAQHAVYTAPLQRIRLIRMSMARGLVRYSNLRMSEIAQRIGYQRVHEFSRAYRQHFGHAPTDERKQTQY